MPPSLKRYLFIIPALLLFSYTSYRAYHLSFTIDEASSFMYYSIGSVRNIFVPVWLDANNHVLNSFLMKVFSTWFPLSEFTLRIQSLFAHILFLIFTWLLLRDFKNIWYKLAIYIFLNVNPFMLDFFSLARGYALSWGFLAGSLFFLKDYLEKTEKKWVKISLSFLMAALAVLSSFSVLSFFVALLLLYICIVMKDILLHGKKLQMDISFWLGFSMVLLISIPTLYYAIDLGLQLKNANQLYFGGNTGFWNDTVLTIFSGSDYEISYNDFIYSSIKVWLLGYPFSMFGIYLIRY